MQQTKQQSIIKSELKGTKATIQIPSHIQQICCRICLQDMSPQQIFTVCKCKGPNSHVHEKCLLEWAKKTQKYRESFNVYFYHCQICKDKIMLEVVTKLKCLKYHQIFFCGEDFCCTISSLIILLLGSAMFIAGLYLKVSSQNSDIGYLFDFTLSLSVIFIIFDLIISILYFILYNQIRVVGILLTQEQRANIRLKQQKVSNSHQEGQNESKKTKKQPNQNLINQTEAFFMQDNNYQQVRQILDEPRFQTLNQPQQQDQSLPRQRILSPYNHDLPIPKIKQQNAQTNTQRIQNQNFRPNQQPINLDNQKNIYTPTLNQNIPENINNQSLIRSELQNINERDYSTSTFQEYETRSIMVRSISIKSREDYKNNLSSYSSTPANNQSSSFSNIENEIGHNQIITPKSIMVKKPNPLTRLRRTLDESMVRSQIHLMEQKRKYYGEGSNEKVSEEGHQTENDVQIYILETSNKSLEPIIQNSSSKQLKTYQGNERQPSHQQNL